MLVTTFVKLLNCNQRGIMIGIIGRKMATNSTCLLQWTAEITMHIQQHPSAAHANDYAVLKLSTRQFLCLLVGFLE